MENYTKIQELVESMKKDIDVFFVNKRQIKLQDPLGFVFPNAA